MASEVCMDKGMSKARPQDHPYHLNKQKCKPRNKDWAIMSDSSKAYLCILGASIETRGGFRDLAVSILIGVFHISVV